MVHVLYMLQHRYYGISRLIWDMSTLTMELWNKSFTNLPSCQQIGTCSASCDQTLGAFGSILTTPFLFRVVILVWSLNPSMAEDCLKQDPLGPLTKWIHENGLWCLSTVDILNLKVGACLSLVLSGIHEFTKSPSGSIVPDGVCLLRHHALG